MKFDQIVQRLESTESNSLDSQSEINPEILGVAPVQTATPGSLSYIEGGKYLTAIATTEASALIIPPDQSLQQQASQRGIAWIATPNPRLLFAQAIGLFYQPFRPAPTVHPSAVIDATAQIGKEIFIGANVVISQGVKIGDRVCIHPNVVVYPGATIGDNTILHANCTIHERAQIGSNCVIGSGAVIGAEGFGFVPSPQGWYKIEQAGCAVLEDGVEIGCNSTVDRPSVGETRIGANTKLDNLVHIGHGCQIGQNCVMAGQTGLAGGVQVGNWVMLGGQVGVANDATIGDRAIASAQTGIYKYVHPGQTVSGSPAVDNKTYLKASAIYKRLPQMYQMLKDISQKLGM